MKTLLLLSSSKFLNNDLTDYLGRPLSSLRIAHIIDASKGEKDPINLPCLGRARGIFRQNGCYFEDLYLEGKKETELRSILKSFDAVFVNGGSTFYLLRAVLASGFAEVVKELLPQGLIYIGSSAGAYVACPTIEMTLWIDPHKYDYCGLTDFKAMNLVPFLVTTHYTTKQRDILRANTAAANYPVKILSNKQAILVKDDYIQILGGKEIKLFK